MPPRVPVTPPRPGTPGTASTTVRNGIAISGRDWSWLALAFNFCIGRGCQLIPAYDPLLTVGVGTTVTFNYKSYQRFSAFQRLWMVRIHRAAVNPPEDYTVSIKVPSGGTAQNVFVPDTTVAQGRFFFIENVTRASGLVDLTLDIINASANTAIIVDEIACVEMPRLLLLGGSDSSEFGVDQDTCRGDEPMFDNTSGLSVGGIIEASQLADAQTTRGGLFVWGVPDASAQTTASTTDVDLFQPTGATTGNPKVPVLASRVGQGVATKTVAIAARMKVSGAGVGGRILVTSRLGATGTLTCTPGATAMAWYTGTLVIDAEDLTTSDGRVGAANEELSVVMKNTGTAGTLSVAAFCVLNG